MDLERVADAVALPTSPRGSSVGERKCSGKLAGLVVWNSGEFIFLYCRRQLVVTSSSLGLEMRNVGGHVMTT